MKKMHSENGEVMIEGLIIVIMTIFILLWLLAVGFLHYQRYLVTVVTNDAAKKVAMTYNNPTADMVMGYIELDDVSKRELYRRLDGGDLFDVNQKRVESYVKFMLSRVSQIDELEVTLDFSADNISASRGHVTVNTKCIFKNPFSSLLKSFGLDSILQFESEAYAECQDLSNYINTTDFVTSITDFDQSKLAKLINSTFRIFFKRQYEQS